MYNYEREHTAGKQNRDGNGLMILLTSGLQDIIQSMLITIKGQIYFYQLGLKCEQIQKIISYKVFQYNRDKLNRSK